VKETFIPSSSNLSEVSYNSETQEMVITFKTGNQYSYRNVPQSVYMSLQRAPSPGSYFYKNIRSSYAGTEV
jgi:hypothetical protein